MMLKVSGLIVTSIFAVASELTSTSELVSIGASPLASHSHQFVLPGSTDVVPHSS